MFIKINIAFEKILINIRCEQIMFIPPKPHTKLNHDLVKPATMETTSPATAAPAIVDRWTWVTNASRSAVIVNRSVAIR